MVGYPTVQTVQATAYRVPTDAPEGDGTLQWNATEFVVVHIRAGGQTGLGYSYTAAQPAAALIQDKLAPCLREQNAFDLPTLWADMNRVLRNIGRPGLGLMAIAAVDQALWDLKAKLLNIPLSYLLGQARTSVKAYGSGGFTTYSDERLERQLSDWLEQGFQSVKVKIGDDIEQARHRVALARSVVGPDVELMVDVNGACHRREAMALFECLREFNVCWMEEPLSSDDLKGLCWLRDRCPPEMAIAAGEYGWDALYFRQMLEAGAVDMLQADATRCGFTGFLKAAELCEAFNAPLSAHCAPQAHVALCAAAPLFAHLEYFHDHARIESKLFDSADVFDRGWLRPNVDRPGHGIELRSQEAEAYRL